MATVTIKEIKEYFGYAKLTDFSKDWKLMSDQDKAQIKAGLENETYTY